MARTPLLICRFMWLGKVDRIARMGHGGADRTTGLQHRRDALTVEMVGVKDQIDAATCRVKRGFAAAGMRHGLFAEAMDFANHHLGLFLVESCNEFAVLAALDPIERYLDAVNSIFDLATNLFDRLDAGGD